MSSRKRSRVDDDGDVDMVEVGVVDTVSPPPRKRLWRCDADMDGVLTHVSARTSLIPSPIQYFDTVVCATTFKLKYRMRQGTHFLTGALCTRPRVGPAYYLEDANCDAYVLIIMGSSETYDYVAHFELVKSDRTVKITRAWTQTLRFVESEASSDEGTLAEERPLACPLHKVVLEVTGRPLHLACALRHSSLTPSGPASVPLMKLGCLANTTTLEDAVAMSRVKRSAATVIQRAWRRYTRAPAARCKMLCSMFSHMQVGHDHETRRDVGGTI